MNELIKLNETEIGDKLVQTVDAENLYTFLEVKSKYADWITRRIKDYGFLENQDYVCISQKKETQRTDGQVGATVVKNYHITLEMAKELAMVERNDKGREARQYFIECEKKLKEISSQLSTKDNLLLGIFKAEGDVNRALAINAYEENYVRPLENKVEEQEEELTITRPKGEYFDALVDRNLSTNFRDTAKELGLGQKYFIDTLIERKFIYRDKRGKIKPYQSHVDGGLFVLKEFVNDKYADVQTLITPEGRNFFRLLLNKD